MVIVAPASGMLPCCVDGNLPRDAKPRLPDHGSTRSSMDSSSVPTGEFVGIVVCLSLSAFFSATETAVTALPRKKVREILDAGGDAARSLRRWHDHPDKVLSTLLVGNNLVNIAMSVMAARVAHHYLASYADAVAVGITTLVVLAVGEVIPKSLARVRSVNFAPIALRLLTPFWFLLYPVAWVYARAAGRVARTVLGPETPQPTVTEGELEYLIEVGQREGIFQEEEQGRLLGAVVEFNDTVAREIMIPRVDVTAIEAGCALQEALDVASRSGHSRIPVYEEDIDKVVGVLHVKELLVLLGPNRPSATRVADLMRKPVLFVPETQRIALILKEIKRRASHMAVVVDEFGGMAGIITLEDIIEELVGDIQDEYDHEERAIKPDGTDGVVVLGKVSLFDLGEHLGVEFPEHSDFDTVGGLVAAELGHIPAPGEALCWAGLRFEVLRASERRVEEVRVTTHCKPPPPDTNGASEPS